MNKLFITCMMSLMVSTALAQRTYFVYLQTEAEQPFYVKLDEKVISSTSSGYVILSRLRDSAYEFSLGFPGNKWPEQKFSVSVGKKDHGYLVKNFGEQGWGLFDLQTLAVQMTGAKMEKLSAAPANREVNAFTDMLSKAANDSTIKEKEVIARVEVKAPEVKIKQPEKKEPVNDPPVENTINKPDEKKAASEPVKNETLPAKQENLVKAEIKPEIKQEEPVKNTETRIDPPREEAKPVEDYVRSKVIRKSESSNTEGFGLVFLDEYTNGKRDTIRILIPNGPPVGMTNPVKNETSPDSKKFLDIPPPDADRTSPVQANSKETVAGKTGLKNPCKEIASDNDFMKLRKKMAAETSDEGMIAEAKKSFRSKCYSTEQVRNLGTLFLSSAGKYSFFDVSYGYVSDAENFPSLQSELKDEYFINRFKAMLRN